MKEVVIIAADLARLHADAGVIERLHRGKALGEEPRLHLPRNFHLVRGTARRLPAFFFRATLRLHSVRHLVDADQHKTVSVEVFKPGEDAAPYRRLPALKHSRRLIIMDVLVLHTPQTRRVMEFDSAFPPRRVFAGDVLGHEDDPGRTSNEFVLL